MTHDKQNDTAPLSTHHVKQHVAWLVTQPRGVIVRTALWSAFRLFPSVGRDKDEINGQFDEADDFGNLVGAMFQAMSLAWTFAKHPSDSRGRVAAESFDDIFERSASAYRTVDAFAAASAVLDSLDAARIPAQASSSFLGRIAEAFGSGSTEGSHTAACQSARKFDPFSASNIDPFVALIVTEGGRSPTGVTMSAAA